ncbi:MAG: ABC transporter permease [Pyrinomonadaceae bacterium]|nr:ABC transporter permease [Pyrinomonadaceae bacterium]
MNKFFAVVKREYKKVVFTWTFLLTTFLMPFIGAMFLVVPMLIFTIEGEQTRIAFADLNGNLAERLKKNLTPNKLADNLKRTAEGSLDKLEPSQNKQIEETAKLFGGNFKIIDYDASGKTPSEIKEFLNSLVAKKELDAYIIIPKDIDSTESKFELYSRKAGDFIINSTLESALSDAVRSQRLLDADISEEKLRQITRRVKLEKRPITETGAEKEDGADPMSGFIIASFLMTILLIYGQAIMAAIVEEKETKISEVLFSSARPFELLMGKLVGVGLAGLTQLAIWLAAASLLLGFGALSASASGIPIELPSITLMVVIYFLIFFLLGFFIYATIYAFIGSMVTNMQEGGQFAVLPVMILIIGLYFCFAVVRDPNSSLAFWMSIAPFFAPIVMPVRILAEVPPFWHIALAILLNGVAIIGLTWLTSRVYRIGMLMYGKRATIPEVWKWIWHS